MFCHKTQAPFVFRSMKPLLVLLIICLLQVNQAEAQEKMSLEDFLNRVSGHNLDLKINQAKTEASEAKARGIALPPPMVGVNQMNERGGTIARGFEVSQMIPFPTKLSSDHAARAYEAKAQKETQRAGSSEVLSSAKLLFVSLWIDQERLGFLKDKEQILQDHVRLSRSTVRSDSFAAVHLLKTESDRDLIENEVVAANQRLIERQHEIASLLNVQASGFHMTAMEPPLSEIPKTTSIETVPQIRAIQFDLESARAREREAVSSWFPDMSVRYKQMGATSMAGPYSEVMIGLTLPFVYFWEPSSEKSRASSLSLQKEYELEKERRSIENKKETLISRAKAFKEQFENLTGKLIPRAEKRVKAVHNLAPRDMETLQDHRDTMEALPDLKIKALEVRIQYEEAISQLEKFSGRISDHE